MYIESLWLNISPLDDYTISFSPCVNVVRGRNGAGKTTVLEAVALFGHLPIIPFSCSLSEECIKGHTRTRVLGRFRLSRRDADFLIDMFVERERELRPELDRYAERVSAALPGTSGRFWTSNTLNRIRTWVNDNAQVLRGAMDFPILTVALATTEARGERERPELKLALTNEEQIRKEWSCFAVEELHFQLAGFLLSISRPEELSEASEITDRVAGFCPGSSKRRWHRPLRVDWLNRKEEAATSSLHEDDAPSPHYLPGLVAYINTDMYQFGVGLDVRETPKELGDDLTMVLAQRLQLVRKQVAVQATNGSSATYRLRSFEQICASWKEIFDLDAKLYEDDPRGPPPEESSGELKGCEMYEVDRNGTISWDIRIGKEERRFFSSGENQSFFLLAITHALQPAGSCLLIDEPDLHMSLGGASQMFNYLFHRAMNEQCQVIVVTHVPYLFTHRHTSGVARTLLIDLHNNRREPWVDAEALRRQSALQAKNVTELFRDIRLSDETLSIWRAFFGWMPSVWVLVKGKWRVAREYFGSVQRQSSN
jgi:predicted ATPase